MHNLCIPDTRCVTDQKAGKPKQRLFLQLQEPLAQVQLTPHFNLWTKRVLIIFDTNCKILVQCQYLHHPHPNQ